MPREALHSNPSPKRRPISVSVSREPGCTDEIGRCFDEFGGWHSASDILDRAADSGLRALARSEEPVGLAAQDRPALQDFDGDGHSDVLWRNPSTGQVTLRLMEGTTRRT
jgi:hypothetical protein